ncbi:cell envelope integrity protein TolA [bacterium]|nr:cell envelope integrity protein TolA [bacterium]
MKKFLVVFLLLLFSVNLFSDDDDKIKLAVMEFEDLSGKIEENILTSATEYIRVVFASTNRYIIISKDRQKNTISEMRKKFNTDPTYKSCTDKNCQIQLGQALSADLIVKTSVSYFAGSYTISSELIDLEKEATIIAAKEDYDGSDRALKTAIDKLVEKIVNVETEVNGEIAAQEKKPRKSSSSKDAIACEYARSESNDFAWKTYLEKYPKGECADEAKDELDKSACKKAEKKNSAAGWKEYLKEFPDGKCEFKAQTTLQKLKAKEQKEAESREKAEAESLEFDSKAEERMDRIFTGRYNFGILTNFDNYEKFGLSTGLDFNFNVFRKPYGGGAGNLYAGLGFDFQFYLPIKSNGDIICMEVPILANFGYDFKVNTHTLRYVGFSFSLGLDILLDIVENNHTFHETAFAWELGFDMIFRSGFLIDLGFGGNARSSWHSSHFFLNIGTIF